MGVDAPLPILQTFAANEGTGWITVSTQLHHKCIQEQYHNATSIIARQHIFDQVTEHPFAFIAIGILHVVFKAYLVLAYFKVVERHYNGGRCVTKVDWRCMHSYWGAGRCVPRVPARRPAGTGFSTSASIASMATAIIIGAALAL